MNGEHAIYVGRPGGREYGTPDATWGATCLLSAYDHELYARWRPGQELAYKATLDALQAARGDIMGEVIPMRLRSHRRPPTGI